MSSPKRCRKQDDDLYMPDDIQNQSNIGNLPEDTLFDYFVQTKSRVIKSWVSRYKKDQYSALVEVLSVILQIAGYKVQITTEIYKQNAYQDVLNEFQEHINDQKPPYDTLKKTIPTFWSDIVSGFMSVNAELSDQFPVFQKWLQVFSSCKARYIRRSSIHCVLALYTSISRAVEDKATIQDNVPRLIDIGQSLYTSIITVRFQDVDSEVRHNTISMVVAGADASPAFDTVPQQMDVGFSLHDQSPRNRACAAVGYAKLVTKDETASHQYIDDVVQLLDDADPKVSVAALEAIGILDQKGLVKADILDHAYQLIVDETPAIRESASKLVRGHIPQTVEGVVEFAKSFGPIEQTKAIASLVPQLDPDEIANSMFQVSDGRLLSAMLEVTKPPAPSILSRLLRSFTDEQTTIHLLKSVVKLDFEHLDDLTDLATEVAHIFQQTTSVSVATECAHVLYLMAPYGFSAQLDELAHTSFDKLACAARYVDISSRHDEVFATGNVECARFLFQWEITLDKHPDIAAYVDLFMKRVEERDGYLGLAILITLAPCIDQEVPFEAQEAFARISGRFRLEGMIEAAPHIEPDLLAFPLVYYAAYPALAKKVWDAVETKPIGGQYVVEALVNAGLSNKEKKTSGRWLAGKVRADDVLNYWAQEEDEEQLDLIWHIIEATPPDDASQFLDRIQNEEVHTVLDRIARGEHAKWHIKRRTSHCESETMLHLKLVSA